MTSIAIDRSSWLHHLKSECFNIVNMTRNTTANIKCPKCGGQARVKSTPNPIRNVIRDYIKCGNCGFEDAVERKQEVTLADWLNKTKT